MRVCRCVSGCVCGCLLHPGCTVATESDSSFAAALLESEGGVRHTAAASTFGTLFADAALAAEANAEKVCSCLTG